MNKFMNGLRQNTNFTLTENGAVTHKSTLNGLMDLFALGGAYRSRSDEDCITLFIRAFDEDPAHALKCLFYLRDVRGGQGERRFFRVVTRWLAINRTEVMQRNLQYVPEFGRWDDLYTFVGTPLEDAAFSIMYHQLALDVKCNTPSLLGKWLKSENTSSKESRKLGEKTRIAFGMSPKQYRKTLSILRSRIRIVEKLMSENRWDEIEFDKIPSKAGLIYRNAFARRDLIKEKYATFAKNKETTVKAGALYPHDIAHRAFGPSGRLGLEEPERIMLQKYWDALPNYYGDHEENAIAVVDVSGSMCGTPMEAAVSMGAYVADKSHGPFAGHFITFSGRPELIPFEGADIVDKFQRCTRASWSMNTNLEAVFDLLLQSAIKHKCSQEDMPDRLYIFSDMEFDQCMTRGPVHDGWRYNDEFSLSNNYEVETLMEGIAKKWQSYGYQLPSVVFWNLNARHDNIPAIGPGFSYVSGFSPVMMQTILSGKDGVDLMLEKLDSERYACIG